MKTLIFSTLGVASVAGLGYGLLPGGEVYALPASEVEAKLHNMDLPDILGVNRAGTMNDLVVEGEPGSSIVWRLRSNGQSVGWIEADMVPVDADHTRVKVDFRMSEAGKDQKTAAFINGQSFIKGVGVIAIGEAIDATLEDREYDKKSVEHTVAAYALSHPTEVAQFGVDLKRFKQESEQSAREWQARYAEPTAGDIAVRSPEAAVRMREIDQREATEAASRPTVDLDRQHEE